jgi:type II secretory pathway pseudopilin PulG
MRPRRVLLKALSASRLGPPGLTLVEMCLALAILGLVAASIATAFIAASDTVEKGREQIELVQAGRAAMNRLLGELRTTSAIASRSDNALRVYCTGTTEAGGFARWVEFWVADATLWRRVDGEEAQALADDVQSLWTGGLVLWSKLDSAGDVVSPQLGPSGSVAGTSSWAPGTFGYGLYAPAGSACRAVFPTSGVLSSAQGTIEFWFRPDFSVTWPGLSHDKYLVDARGGTDEIVCFYDVSAKQLVFSVAGKEVDWEPTWAPGQWVHIALVWDCTGQEIGGGRTVALYVDGVLCGGSAQTGTWSLASLGASFALGNLEGVEAEGVFDNLRVYDYCTTDFRARYREQALGLMRVRLTLEDDATGRTFTIASGVAVE